MTDRESLLRACADPKDRTARLIYSDWLEEHGTSIADAASCEWLRLTNHESNLTKTGRVKRASFDWLKENWWRLVATARSSHVDCDIKLSPIGESPFGGYDNQPQHRWATSRTLHTYWNLYRNTLANVEYPISYRVRLTFGNGFLDSFSASNAFAQQELNHLVLLDQPLVDYVGFAKGHAVQCPRCGWVWELQGWIREMREFICDRPHMASRNQVCGQVFRRVRKNLYESAEVIEYDRYRDDSIERMRSAWQYQREHREEA